MARAPGEEKRTFMWCARTAPADSPATRTLASSACLVGGWVGGGGMVMLSRAEPEEDGGRVVDDSMVAARWLQAAWKIGHA